MKTYQVSLPLTLLQCDFCGSLHGSAADAKAHGCADGEPPCDFKVGDVVIAKVSIGAGMELIASPMAMCRIVRLDSPVSYRNPKDRVFDPASLRLNVRRQLGYDSYESVLRLDRMLTCSPHQWLAGLECLETLKELGYDENYSLAAGCSYVDKLRRAKKAA